MTILKEREAVDYLQRARSCLHPYEDIFSHLPMLSRMLDIQSAFIERKMVTGPEELTQVLIDSSGFPEIESWREDIKRAFRMVTEFKAQRIQNLNPWLEQFRVSSAEGVEKEGEKVALQLAQEKNFMGVFGGISENQERFILGSSSIKGEPYPFGRDSQSPGLLIAYDYISPLQKNLTAFVPKKAGLKYVDAKSDSKRWPVILYIHLEHTENKKQHPVLLNPSSILTKDSYGELLYIHPKCRTVTDRYEKCDCLSDQAVVALRKAEFKGIYLENIYKQQPRELLGPAFFHPSILNALVSQDITSFNDQKADSFIAGLFKFNLLIAEVIGVTKNFTDGDTIDPIQFNEASKDFSSKMRLAYEALYDDQLIGVFEIALAQASIDIKNQIKGTMDKLALPSAETASAVPKERLGWLKRSAWFAR